jgi:hypothetical protein
MVKLFHTISTQLSILHFTQPDFAVDRRPDVGTHGIENAICSSPKCPSTLPTCASLQVVISASFVSHDCLIAGNQQIGAASHLMRF